MMKCDHCETDAVALKGDNGVVDPADGARVEFYECENGHEFSYVLA